MDTPADPATPLSEVYQAFFADLAKEGTSTIDRYRYNIVHPAILSRWSGRSSSHASSVPRPSRSSRGGRSAALRRPGEPPHRPRTAGVPICLPSLQEPSEPKSLAGPDRLAA
jgi:hypothetical protein